MDALKVPFDPADVQWLPGSTTKDGGKCRVMAYADLRAYQDRLDEVCGDGWQVNYTPWGERLICNLTIDGITRSSTGEPDSQSEKREIGGTVAEAQAFKRACAMFGLGRYLYNLPAAWVEFDKANNRITDKAKAELDQRYRTWYDKTMAAKTPQNGRTAPTTSYPTAGAAKTQQRPATQPTAHVDDAPPVDENGPFDDVAPEPMVDDTTQKRLHALGTELYGADWDRVRHENIGRLTHERTHSSKDLTLAEAKRLIAGMVALQAKMQQPDAKARKAQVAA